MHVTIDISQIKNSSYKRLAGIDIDCKLSSENHTNKTCTKTKAKTKALPKIAPFLNKVKRKLLMNAFIKSHQT